MLPNEFKARLLMLNMTMADFAEVMELSTRTVYRWANETIIPTMAIYALKGLEAERKSEV